MKSILSILGCSLLTAFLLMSFSLPIQPENEKITLKSRNSCTVVVKNSSGSRASNVKVVGEVCGGISCIGMTKKVYTNSDGEATVTWSDGCKLCYLYIDGKSHKGSYRNGETYYITK